MTTPSTSLHIRWAKAIGWRAYQCGEHSHSPGKWRLDPPQQNAIVAERFDSEEEAFELYGPQIDANTVRMALMGMSEEEWVQFEMLFWNRVIKGTKVTKLVQVVLTEEPETLAEIYCEVKGTGCK